MDALVYVQGKNNYRMGIWNLNLRLVFGFFTGMMAYHLINPVYADKPVFDILESLLMHFRYRWLFLFIIILSIFNVVLILKNGISFFKKRFIYLESIVMILLWISFTILTEDLYLLIPAFLMIFFINFKRIGV